MQEWQEKIEREIGQLRQEVNQIKNQKQTDQMKAIDVASILTRLDKIEQDLETHSKTWLDTLQEHYTDHTAHFKKIEETMATKHDLASMEERIIDAIRNISSPGKN